MGKGNIFYLIFISTILAIRLGVFILPQRKLIIGGMIIHHFWLGVILILFVFLLFKMYNGLKVIMLSAGLGLASDEFIYIILGDGPVSNYWSIYSVSGTVVISAIIFVARNRLVKKIYKENTF